MEHNGKRILTVQDLTVRFDTSERSVVAVQGLNFHVNAGETLAIVGESGSGKSVTSLSIMRLVEHGGGRIASGSAEFCRNDGTCIDLFQAQESTLRSIRGGDISMIFQEPMTSLNPVFSVGFQIEEAIRLHQKLNHSAAKAEALRMLELVRISDARQVLTRYPHQLSGGMRQRVMIAMALSCNPALLIADEPTTALDVTIQAQILQLIYQLQDDIGMGVIFITHDMGVVAEVADRVLVMYRGEAVEEGSVGQIFHSPNHPYTKALLSAVPILGAMTGTSLPAPFPLLHNQDLEAESMGMTSVQKENKDNTHIAKEEETILLTPETDAPPILQVKQLVTRFDVEKSFLGTVKRQVYAVEKIDLELFAGETLGLVGESGCGKSTLGRSIIGLEKPLSGSIIFEGHEMLNLPWNVLQKLRRNIQYVFQDPYASLDPRLTVGFSIMEPLLIHKICSRHEAEKKVAWLLEKVGLEPDVAARYPHEFSGGQRQRVCIARALAMNPKIIIADESVSALDVSVRAQIVNLLLDLQQEFRIAMIFISHDMAVIERVCHRVAVMYLGQIVELGTRQAVFENPLHPYTRRLMAAVPIPDPERRSMVRTLLSGEIPSPVRKVGDAPLVAPLVEQSPGHLVAMHEIVGNF